MAAARASRLLEAAGQSTELSPLKRRAFNASDENESPSQRRKINAAASRRFLANTADDSASQVLRPPSIAKERWQKAIAKAAPPPKKNVIGATAQGLLEARKSSLAARASSLGRRISGSGAVGAFAHKLIRRFTGPLPPPEAVAESIGPSPGTVARETQARREASMALANTPSSPEHYTQAEHTAAAAIVNAMEEGQTLEVDAVLEILRKAVRSPEGGGGEASASTPATAPACEPPKNSVIGATAQGLLAARKASLSAQKTAPRVLGRAARDVERDGMVKLAASAISSISQLESPRRRSLSEPHPLLEFSEEALSLPRRSRSYNADQGDVLTPPHRRRRKKKKQPAQASGEHAQKRSSSSGSQRQRRKSKEGQPYRSRSRGDSSFGGSRGLDSSSFSQRRSVSFDGGWTIEAPRRSMSFDAAWQPDTGVSIRPLAPDYLADRRSYSHGRTMLV